MAAFLFFIFSVLSANGEQLMAIQNSEDEEREQKTLFRLSDLPYVAMKRVMDSMHCAERTKLALSSKKMYYYTFLARTKASCIQIHINEEKTNIELKGKETKLLCGNEAIENFEGITVAKQDLSRWFDANDEEASVLQNTVSIFNRTKELFPCPHLHLYLNLEETKKTSFKELLTIEEFKNWTYLRIENGELSTEDLNSLMNAADMKKFIKFHEVKIPVDYQHEKAFQFCWIRYNDARWARIENLFSIRDCKFVSLGNTNFNNMDLNKLIKHWINNNCDMFKTAQFEFDENKDFDLNALFDDVITLETTNAEQRCFSFISNSPKERLFPCGTVVLRNNQFHMNAWSPTKYTTPGKPAQFYKEFEILLLLNNKVFWEKKMEECEKKTAIVEDMIQENVVTRDKAKDKLDELTTQEQMINKQIRNFEKRLKNYTIRFVNGRAVSNL